MYDAALVGDPAATRGPIDMGTRVDDTAGAGSDGANDSRSQNSSRCGDGRVDDDERCDTAIARGASGACPEVCRGRDGCYAQQRVGEACDAHCEEVAIVTAVDGDGCCLAGMSSKDDDDCRAVCGNGVIEKGETCDPPDSCPTREGCTLDDACAVFEGSPGLCTATCMPATRDDDCAGGRDLDAGAQPTPTLTDAGCDGSTCPEPEPEDTIALQLACSQAHAGGRCEACDCANCAALTLTCLKGTDAADNAACDAVLECARRNRCSGIDCYCGGASVWGACETRPDGPCVTPIRRLAGTRNVVQVFLTALNTETALGRAASVLSCRQRSCEATCGL